MSFKFIDTEYTGMDAVGAPVLSNQNFGHIFGLQSQRFAFRVGNTSSTVRNYQLTASGQNAVINAEVEFSKDKSDWLDQVCMSGIQPNNISDPVWCRFTPTEEMFLTSGTFLIQCSEVL
jgi:hypothetical protein